MSRDPEFTAMRKAMTALEALDEEGQRRVLMYLAQRYGYVLTSQGVDR